MVVERINPECGAPYCVLGAVDNERGIAILHEMLEWLTPFYDLHVVHHDGTQFEQPALRYLQDLCLKEQKPCLYLHTKGAFNRPELSAMVREIWKHEFVKNQGVYFSLVDRPYAVVACPFTGSDKTTWYNGFVANWRAMQEIPLIEPSASRMKFERLFIGQHPQVIGVIRNDMHREIGHIDQRATAVWNLISQ